MLTMVYIGGTGSHYRSHHRSSVFCGAEGVFGFERRRISPDYIWRAVCSRGAIPAGWDYFNLGKDSECDYPPPIRI